MSKHNVTIGRGPAACRSGTMQLFRRLILIITYIKIVLSVFEGLLRRLLWGEEAVTVNPQSVCGGPGGEGTFRTLFEMSANDSKIAQTWFLS
jgi:hypothetical protein